MLVISFIIPRFLFHSRISSSTTYVYLIFGSYSLISWALFSSILGNYAEKIITQFESFSKRSLQVFLLWIIFVLLYLFFSREVQVSRFFVFSFMTIFAIGLFFNRFLYLGIRNYFKSKDYLVNNIIILGYNETALKLSSYFEQESINTNLIGFVEDEKNIKELTHYPVLSDIKNLIQVAKDYDVQEIFSTITPEQNSYIYELITQAENACIRFKVVPDLSHFFNKPVVVDFIRDLPVLSLRSEPLDDVGNKLKKRILDIVVSGLVIIFILSWLIPIVALLILLESRGSIFFSQKRTGKNNLPFNCLKFRN